MTQLQMNLYFLQSPFYRAVSELLMFKSLERKRNICHYANEDVLCPKENYCLVCISCQTKC